MQKNIGSFLQIQDYCEHCSVNYLTKMADLDAAFNLLFKCCDRRIHLFKFGATRYLREKALLNCTIARLDEYTKKAMRDLAQIRDNPQIIDSENEPQNQMQNQMQNKMQNQMQNQPEMFFLSDEEEEAQLEYLWDNPEEEEEEEEEGEEDEEEEKEEEEEEDEKEEKLAPSVIKGQFIIGYVKMPKPYLKNMNSMTEIFV